MQFEYLQLTIWAAIFPIMFALFRFYMLDFICCV